MHAQAIVEPVARRAGDEGFEHAFGVQTRPSGSTRRVGRSTNGDRARRADERRESTSPAAPFVSTSCGPSTANGIGVQPAREQLDVRGRQSRRGRDIVAILTRIRYQDLAVGGLPESIARLRLTADPLDYLDPLRGLIGSIVCRRMQRSTPVEGDFKVRLFDDKAPKTVANFVGLAEGTKEWTDPKIAAEGDATVLRRSHLPSRDRRLHACRAAVRWATGWAARAISLRMSLDPDSARSAGPAVDGQRRPQHQRQPVLRHAGADALARQ